MKLFYCVIFMFGIANVLKAQYIPPQRIGVTDLDYQKWVKRIRHFNNKLNRGNEALDKVTKIGFFINYSTAYFELKEPVDSVYNKLKKAILIDEKLTCIHLNSYNEMGKNLPNFIVIENRIGQLRWENLMQNCGGILEKEKIKKKEELKQEYENNKDRYNFELINKLMMIFERDQKVRREWFRVKREYGESSKEEIEHIKKVHFQDSINLLVVEKIIEKFGYPGKSLVGSECQTYAMWIIHHAKHNEIRDKYFPILYKAASKGELDISSFKLYIDRIHTIKFGTQLYGTQSQYNSATDIYEQVPIEDEANYKQRFRDLSVGEISLGRINLNDYENN